jgi:hypothetical protein
MLDVDTTIDVLRSPERKAIGMGLFLDCVGSRSTTARCFLMAPASASAKL